MNNSSVDPTVEIEAIKARLDTLAEPCFEGIEQATQLPRDGFGNRDAYRDLEGGSSTKSASGRLLGAHEQAQPYIWAFQVHHFAPTRKKVREMRTATDRSLIGWEPSTNAGQIGKFFFTTYDEFTKDGERIGWIATDFYECELGQSPDLTL